MTEVIGGPIARRRQAHPWVIAEFLLKLLPTSTALLAHGGCLQ